MTATIRPPISRPQQAMLPPPTAPLTFTAHRTPTEHAEIGAVSFLLCGAPGSGKTHFGAGMPDPLFFQWDSNMKTLEKWTNVPFLVPTDWTPENETSTTLAFSERVLPLLEARRAHEIAGNPVQSIIFDTGTEMADDLSARIIGTKTNLKDSQARFGEFLREGHSLFRRIADLAKPRGTLPRYNVAVMFHLTDVTDDRGNLKKVAPAIVGRLKGEIQRRFDVGLLMRCRAENSFSVETKQTTTTRYYEACTVPPDIFHEGLAFDRVGGAVGSEPWHTLPAVIVNPSYNRLIELWTSGEQSS